MGILDVEVIVTRETQALTQAGFGLPLIVSADSNKGYAEFTSLSEVSEKYSEETNAYKMANRVFGQSPRPPKIAMFGVDAEGPSEITAALNELVETKNDWYFLLCDNQAEATIQALSTWVDAQNKLYFATTDDLDVPAGLESERTIIMYHDSDPTVAAGWVGRCAPELPGSITWKFKTINGVLEADIGVTDLTQLHKDGGNSYVRKLGILQSSEGFVTSGEYIDVMRSQDFIEARLTEQVSRLLFTKKKVPYDNSGIALIIAECETVMKLATNQGIIALDDDGNGMWTIIAPRREDIPTNDIANRKLDNVIVEATLAGAIHNATIRVTLKY